MHKRRVSENPPIKNRFGLLASPYPSIIALRALRILPKAVDRRKRDNTLYLSAVCAIMWDIMVTLLSKHIDGGVSMDWTVILGAVISGTVSLIVCIITQFAQNKVTRALLEYRLTELEKKVDKHNNLVERMYRAEENIAVLTERMDDSK
jgi:hypothetical protein